MEDRTAPIGIWWMASVSASVGTLVGIAMGTGTDMAMESPGVTLVKGDLRGIARACRFGYLAVMLAMVVTGCASVRLDPVMTDVAVDPKDSSSARVTTVQVRDHDGRLKVSGRLEKRYTGRGPIPGHLDIEALARDGALLAEATTRYRQINPKTGESEFSQILDVGPERVKAVRVAHHLHDGDEDATDDKAQPRASCQTRGSSQSV